MTRSLVLQLGRLGDVIQTTPLLSDIAAAGDEVDMLVLRSAHEPLLGFSAVTNIITIPDSLKPLDDAIACGFPHGKIPSESRDLLADLQLPLYDRVINASHAPLGCWLAGTIPCTNPSARHGGIIRDRECLYLGHSSVYRIALLQFREQNLFNLVDLLRAVHGIAPPTQQPCLYTNRSVDLPFALPPGRKVALNPGASEAARCWPGENFARIADALSTAGFVPVLVGAPSDRELCEKIKSTARVPISNFAGRTSVPEMASLLARCELLVCADTGAAHLAAAVGTTVVGLYGAAAWFAETAPYGDNHLILQTPLNSPMSAISFDGVLASVLNRLRRLSDNDLRRELCNQNQSAWATSIHSPSNTLEGDPLGGLMYRPMHRDSLTPGELFARSLRQAFAAEFLSLAAPSRSTKTQSTFLQSDHFSLAQVLDQMRDVANCCADALSQSTLNGIPAANTDTQSAASTLMFAMEKLRALTAEPARNLFRLVIHYLDWQLRMLPQQSPEQTFRNHANAYASAARILQASAHAAASSTTQNATRQSGETKTEQSLGRELLGKELLGKKEKRGDRCLVR